jgi:hypothetical protein
MPTSVCKPGKKNWKQELNSQIKNAGVPVSFFVGLAKLPSTVERGRADDAVFLKRSFSQAFPKVAGQVWRENVRGLLRHSACVNRLSHSPPATKQRTRQLHQDNELASRTMQAPARRSRPCVRGVAPRFNASDVGSHIIGVVTITGRRHAPGRAAVVASAGSR